ncbi:hypothetical protein BLOT_014631 [Blomia tropicalis]|nr:hypothetical protein BLOT_014631 [Blomia tropicalis]
MSLFNDNYNRYLFDDIICDQLDKVLDTKTHISFIHIGLQCVVDDEGTNKTRLSPITPDLSSFNP